MENCRQERRYQLPWAKHVQDVKGPILSVSPVKGQIDTYRDAGGLVKCIPTSRVKKTKQNENKRVVIVHQMFPVGC